MTKYFISRHKGAKVWAEQQGLKFDVYLPHLDSVSINQGDIVAGTLPVNLAAKVCEQGGHYWNLSLDLPVSARGRELTADELTLYGAVLEEFMVRKGRID